MTERTEPMPSEPKRKRSWLTKFGAAFRGLKWGIRGHSSFFVHFFFTALIIAAAIVVECDFVEWSILLLCIGLVLTAELFNSAVETLFRGLDEAARERSWRCLDIAAGAVLMASITAAVVGLVVLLHRVKLLL